MSELYKAMKRIEDYQSTKPLYKQIAEIKGIASTARYGYDIQPQLTIPKSIADKLDKVSFHNPISQLTKESGDLTDFDSDVKDYAWKNKNNGYICVAYLAGKALGVDLVKVVEGEIWN